MPLSADQLAALGTTPIEGDLPAGHRIAGFGRLDELVFAKIFNTVSPDPASVDWPEVLEEGTRLLERSRDLRFARWVAHALLETRGLEGLELGIRLLADLATTFGADLHPLDGEKRIREMSGFDEFAAATLERLDPRNGDPGRTLTALATLERSFLAFPGGGLPAMRRIGEWIDRTYPEASPEGEITPTEASDSPPEGPTGTEAAPPREAPPTPDPVPAGGAPAEKPARFERLASAPISDSDPAGPRLTDWGRLATEYFQKLSSPTASGEIDWPNVRDAALELLDTSKDIRAALVAVSGLMHIEGLIGLADGLELLALLGDSFGDALHPRDPGDRLKKIADFDVKASAWFGEEKDGIKEDARELLGRVERMTQQAKSALGPVCGDDMIFVRIGRAVSDHLKELEARIEGRKAAAAEPAPAPAAEEGGRQAPVTRSAPPPPAVKVPAAVETPDQVKRALADAQRLILLAVGYYREKRPGEAFVRRLERVGLWLRVTDTPKDGVITGPSPETAARLTQGTGGSPASLEELEKITTERFLWLTAQRLLHGELLRQGREAEAESIRAETAAFASSLPGITEVRFKEGVPLIDEATSEWLGSASLAGEPSLPLTTIPGAEGEQEERQALREQAKELASEGKLPEAIALYQSAWQQSRSARQSFLWKLDLARFCTSHNPSIATSILSELEREVSSKGIATWEPELAIVVFTELLKLTPEKNSARREELFGKLVLVDPQRAARIQFAPPEKRSTAD